MSRKKTANTVTDTDTTTNTVPENTLPENILALVSKFETMLEAKVEDGVGKDGKKQYKTVLRTSLDWLEIFNSLSIESVYIHAFRSLRIKAQSAKNLMNKTEDPVSRETLEKWTSEQWSNYLSTKLRKGETKTEKVKSVLNDVSTGDINLRELGYGPDMLKQLEAAVKAAQEEQAEQAE